MEPRRLFGHATNQGGRNERRLRPPREARCPFPRDYRPQSVRERSRSVVVLVIVFRSVCRRRASPPVRQTWRNLSRTRERLVQFRLLGPRSFLFLFSLLPVIRRSRWTRQAVVVGRQASARFSSGTIVGNRRGERSRETPFRFTVDRYRHTQRSE